MTDWHKLHDLNRRWRSWMDANSTFRSPAEPITILRDLADKCNAARRVWIFENEPTPTWRSKPDSTIHQELGQAVMLALTYLPDAEVMRGWGPLNEDIDYICFCPAQAIVNHDLYMAPHVASEWIRNCLATINGYPGMDVAHELRECHRRLGWRWASEEWAKLGSEI